MLHVHLDTLAYQPMHAKQAFEVFKCCSLSPPAGSWRPAQISCRPSKCSCCPPKTCRGTLWRAAGWVHLFFWLKTCFCRAWNDILLMFLLCSQGAASMKEFYAKNSRWTEGLISASKAVGWGATMLVWVTQTVRKSNLGRKLWHSDLKISVAQWNPLYFFQNYFVIFPRFCVFHFNGLI